MKDASTTKVIYIAISHFLFIYGLYVYVFIPDDEIRGVMGVALGAWTLARSQNK